VSRQIHVKYQDPADLIWLHAADQLDIRVVRSADAYAAWDGQGTLTLASDDYLDPDDCLAQMIFHEICHLLISGEASRNKPDWGLDNTSPKDLVYEYATNRLQAGMSGAYGLRQFMAVTTMWRSYYDGLPRDPLNPLDADPAVELARQGFKLAQQAPYREVLDAALSATAALAQTLKPVLPPDSLWKSALGAHPTGFHQYADESRLCRDCAWGISRKDGNVDCRMTRPGCRPASYGLSPESINIKKARLMSGQTACEYFETAFADDECLRCGACCREGFDVVEVGPRERFKQNHPELLEVRDDGRQVVPRPEGRCIALSGTGDIDDPFLCRCYDDRPKSCRDFAMGGDACLVARQRINIR